MVVDSPLGAFDHIGDFTLFTFEKLHVYIIIIYVNREMDRIEEELAEIKRGSASRVDQSVR